MSKCLSGVDPWILKIGCPDQLLPLRGNAASLAELMRAVGLVNVRQEPAQYKMREPRDMRLVGIKP